MICAEIGFAGSGFAGSGEAAEASRGVQQSAASKARIVVACNGRLCGWVVFMADVIMENGGFLWWEVRIVIFIGF